MHMLISEAFDSFDIIPFRLSVKAMNRTRSPLDQKKTGTTTKQAKKKLE